MSTTESRSCCCLLYLRVCGVDINGNMNLHSQLFLKHDPQWHDECSSNLCFNKVSLTCIFPQKQSFSKAQPPFMWYENVYAAMSNLAGVSGIFVSGLLCCALSFERTVSLHLLRELLTISTVDMVLSHLAQYIIFPLTLSDNSLCLAHLKSISFFSEQVVGNVYFQFLIFILVDTSVWDI